jgi:hypothetical protein
VDLIDSYLPEELAHEASKIPPRDIVSDMFAFAARNYV